MRVLGGTHLRELNAALDARGLALPNMGGYDAQTIAGVVSTSTHGSGLRWGPFPDLVRSLDLVVAGGEVVRVEPAGGITDPARYDGRLIQDDATFFAAVCGIGTLGLIHSLVIEVREKFFLNEVRTARHLGVASATRVTPDGVLGEGDHYELFVNPYAGKGGEHRVVVTRRGDWPDPPDEPEDKLERHPLTELESKLPITGLLLRLARAALAGAARLALRLRARRDGRRRLRERLLQGLQHRRGEHACPPSRWSSGSRSRATATSRRSTASSPSRPSAASATSSSTPRRSRCASSTPSPAYASMMHGQQTMMIELILVDGTRGGDELLAGYERDLADLGARPHWGQINALTPERVRELYPRWDDWLAVERELNSSGVFDSPFTRRVGI